MSPSNNNLLPIVAAIALACAATSANAIPYTIDGVKDDWNINTLTLVSSTAKSQTIEDQTGGSGTYLNPGYGGQKYDAEAMYLDWDASYLYVGVLTGLPKNNPNGGGSYGPGDIILDFGRDGNPEFAFVVTSLGGFTPGALYKPGTWSYGLWSAPNVLATTAHPSPDEVAIKTGTYVTTGELAYSSSPITGLGAWGSDQHYFIEAKIPTSAFGSLWSIAGPKVDVDVSWAALCANDIIKADPQPVPEPATIGLLGVAMGSIVWLRRRSRSRSSPA
jgi:hypothetical protein